MLFPAFVSVYINTNNKVCLYYFRGLDEQCNWIYQQFNEEQMPENTKIINDDGSIIYEFKHHVNAINCHLISDKENIKDKNINIKV